MKLTDQPITLTVGGRRHILTRGRERTLRGRWLWRLLAWGWRVLS